MSNDAEGASDATTEASADADDDTQAVTDESGQHADEPDDTTGGQEQPAADRESALAERVRAEAGDDLAAEVADLESRVEDLEADLAAAEAELADTEAELADAETEIEDLTERLQSKQADFQNYKQRAKRKQDRIRERATEDLAERLLDVRDNLGRALEEDSDDVDALREGVELTRKEFDRVLDDEGVEEIRPDPGEDVDAQRHEVMMRVESDQPADSVVDVYRPGYEMAGKVLRTAQVTVSDGNNSQNGGDDEDTGGDGEGVDE